MKKLLLIFLTGLLLISCGYDEGMSQQEYKEIQYEQAFEKAFGKISPTQTWGFNQLNTRAAQPNSNEWGTGKYKDFPRPSNITQSEVDKVLAVFNQKGKESYESLIDWSNFFVQQVWKGTASYTAGNGGTVIGGNQMDWLCAYDPTGHKEIVYIAEYNWQPHEIINHDDHVNNFNNANGSVMLMFNSSTQRFGYKSSTDNGHVFYYFRMEEIDGNYYVGFDFSAEGQNPNEQVQRDLIYNDWIVKIVPGKGTPPPDFVKEEGMIICEDLGTVGDFDFNDVVFYAKVWNSGRTEINLLAAGGTLDISVAGVNVGSVMGKMVNTGLKNVSEYYFVADNTYNSLIEIPIVVQNTDAAGNVTSYTLSAEMGKAPQKICVPLGFKWCLEYKSLVDAYPGFKDWTTGKSDTWCGNYNSSLVFNKN